MTLDNSTIFTPGPVERFGFFQKHQLFEFWFFWILQQQHHSSNNNITVSIFSLEIIQGCIVWCFFFQLCLWAWAPDHSHTAWLLVVATECFLHHVNSWKTNKSLNSNLHHPQSQFFEKSKHPIFTNSKTQICEIQFPKSQIFKFPVFGFFYILVFGIHFP